jgi:hypothetical protein
MNILDEVKSIGEQAKQNKAVAQWLEKEGTIDNNTAIYDGVPNYGRLKRLAARIGDLREAGWEIYTDDARRRPDRNTHYRLVSKPHPTTLFPEAASRTAWSLPQSQRKRLL